MRAVKIDPVSRTVTEIDLKKNPNLTFDELYELIITTLLFITLLTGFGALYIAIPLALCVWSITGLCLIAFVGIRIVIW